MTISEFVRKHKDMNPNSHYFSSKTLDYFGEKLDDMRILDNTVKVITNSGETRECYALSRLQREYPGGPKQTVAYFDVFTMSEVQPRFLFMPDYETGAEAWRDAVVRYGRDAALAVCGNHLDARLQIEQSDSDMRFCRELFAVIYGESMRITDPAKLVYPYDFTVADSRAEAPLYHNSRNLNEECAKALDNKINASWYKPNYYNLELAAMNVINAYGFERVTMVLAKQIHSRQSDGRFSSKNKNWAENRNPQTTAFIGANLNAHPVLLDGFATHVRGLYTELNAHRFELPGQIGDGVAVDGYEIAHCIEFDDRRGFVISVSDNDFSPCAVFHCITENGERDFYNGEYHSDMDGARQDYVARVISYMSGSAVKQVRWGQASDEPSERGAEDEKPSVLNEIRESRSAPKAPSKPKPERDKTKKKGQQEH